MALILVVVFFFLCQAAGLAPTLEQIEMLSQQLPDASLVKLYVSPRFFNAAFVNLIVNLIVNLTNHIVSKIRVA